MSFQNKMVQQVPGKKDKESGNSLVAQWSGFSAFTARDWVQSLVGELKSHKPHGLAEKKKKNYQTKVHQYIIVKFQNAKNDPKKIPKR